MANPVLFRKRLIPDECICLKDDEIVYLSEENQVMVTKWHALKPRNDLHHGYSAYFWNEGFKLSKFYQEDGSLLYWYCDIIDVEYPANVSSDSGSSSSFIATDLLADVIIYPDGFVKVVDLDELALAFEQGILSPELLRASLHRLDHLLNLAYSGELLKYQQYLEQCEEF